MRGQTIAPGIVAVGLGVCLESGLKGIIQAPYLTDDQTGQIHVDNYVRRGQTIALGTIAVGLNLAHESITVELSTQPADMQEGDS